MGLREPSTHTNTFLDDRGQLLRLESDGAIRDEVGARPATLSHMAMWVLIAASAGWSLYQFIQRPGLPSAGQFGVMLLLLSALWAVQRVLARTPAAKQSPLTVELTAHRLCGACGYDLHQVAPESDGCVVCPECGGSWHCDRFVRADCDAKESEMLRSLLSTGHTLPKEFECDDRGGKLTMPARWPPHWLHGISATHAELLRLRARRTLRTFLRWSILGGLVLWTGLVCLILTFAQDRELDQIILVIVVTLLIVVIATYAAGRVFIDRAMLRPAVDELGLCNNCGHSLPADASPAFDGCVVCGVCARAWRRAERCAS